MKVKDLIELLSRSPQENVVIVEALDGKSLFEISDVCVGYGTIKGLTYIEVLEEEGLEEEE